MNSKGDKSAFPLREFGLVLLLATLLSLGISVWMMLDALNTIESMAHPRPGDLSERIIRSLVPGYIGVTTLGCGLLFFLMARRRRTRKE